MTALMRFSESLTVNNSIHFKRSELIKSKGRIEIPSFFSAENLPKLYKERLDMGKVFVSTGCKRGYTMRTLVYGTKGTLIFDNKSDTMTFFEVNPEDVDHKAEEKIIPVDINNHNAASEFKTFADHILNDTPVTTDVMEGAKTALACISIVESSVTGKVINPDYSFS